jgi:hypothetical protein
MTVEEQILSILNNSVKPNEVPISLSLTGTEYQLIINPTLNRVERILVSNPDNFITINVNSDDVIFRLVKGYTGAVQNTGVNIEINDHVSNGNIYIDSTNILIKTAKYNGGDITNFGTYDNVNKTFTGGSYDIVEWIEI